MGGCSNSNRSLSISVFLSLFIQWLQSKCSRNEVCCHLFAPTPPSNTRRYVLRHYRARMCVCVCVCVWERPLTMKWNHIFWQGENARHDRARVFHMAGCQLSWRTVEVLDYWSENEWDINCENKPVQTPGPALYFLVKRNCLMTSFMWFVSTFKQDAGVESLNGEGERTEVFCAIRFQKEDC